MKLNIHIFASGEDNKQPSFAVKTDKVNKLTVIYKHVSLNVVFAIKFDMA